MKNHIWEAFSAVEVWETVYYKNWRIWDLKWFGKAQLFCFVPGKYLSFHVFTFFFICLTLKQILKKQEISLDII